MVQGRLYTRNCSTRNVYDFCVLTNLKSIVILNILQVHVLQIKLCGTFDIRLRSIRLDILNHLFDQLGSPDVLKISGGNTIQERMHMKLPDDLGREPLIGKLYICVNLVSSFSLQPHEGL